jgi:hypothetical protein
VPQAQVPEKLMLHDAAVTEYKWSADQDCEPMRNDETPGRDYVCKDRESCLLWLAQ